MFFRRELDFDELIEAIDQLTDEQIEETVDWQMTESPAAKKEGIGRERALRPSRMQAPYRPALPNAPWLEQQRTQVERYELPPDRRSDFVIPDLPSTITFDQFDSNPRYTIDMTYQRITHDVQTMWDPLTEILHIRLAWSTDGQSFRYQQVGITRAMLEDVRASVEIVRSEEIAPGRTIAVYLDPEARNRQYPIRVFMETEDR